MAAAAQTHEFQAEVAKLLHLMVHSVYSEREVFLRELISNGADACDKLRYEAITQPELLSGDPDLQISITFDEKASTLTVADNGVGMNHDELVSNLGTIARSGTKAFMESAKDDENDENVNLIGQFGVGFYSAFMVASKVNVYARRAGDEQGWVWTSDGTGKFTIKKSDKAPERGTRIELKLRKKDAEFLEDMNLRRIVRTYSDHIAIPIMLYDASKEESDEEDAQLNAASALWTRAKSDISEEQHKEFFGHISGLYNDPALTIHYRAEGRHEYNVLLYIPGEQPYDLFDPERRGKLKLYVRRVFICDDAEILPPYLRFVRGVIDSEDMPLNISREMLQNNPIVAQIRKAVTKRVLSELTKLSKKDAEAYEKVWTALGPVIKEGLYEDFERRDDLFALARFETTKGDGLRTLADYVADMKESQTAIYFMTGNSKEALENSPQVEGFKARGIEVLLLTDPVDNFWTTTAVGFDGKPFRSITQGASDLDDLPAEEESKDQDGADDAETATLISALKTALGDKVSDIRKSSRLTDSPVCLVAGEGGLDRNLEKILHAQKTAGVERTSPVLEINAGHVLVKALAQKAGADGAQDVIPDAAGLLLDQAYILDG
ncbi:MAG: molecular chaperone HtpG, partial [Hyphomicrobiales bacterium]